MSCEICKPAIENGRSDFTPGHKEYEKNIMWNHGNRYSISIYPKPYKAHKFYKLLAIRFCPYCGEDLKAITLWQPQLIEELEE